MIMNFRNNFLSTRFLGRLEKAMILLTLNLHLVSLRGSLKTPMISTATTTNRVNTICLSKRSRTIILVATICRPKIPAFKLP